MSPRLTLQFIAAITIAAAGVAAAPVAAHAGGYACSSSAVKATVLGATFEPVRAGAPDACPTTALELDTLGAPLSGAAATARTGRAGDGAGAGTSLAGFEAGSLTALVPELPQIAVPAGLDALRVPLPASAQLLGLPSVLTVDATNAARALVDPRTLADVPLLAAGLVQTGVSAVCKTGQLVFDSLANVEQLTALGRALPTAGALDTSVPLADADTVDFSALDLDAVELPGGLSLDTPVTGPVLRAALANVVAGLPSVSVPAALGRIVVEPARRDGAPDSLRQLGPRVRVEVLGREVADVTLGDALVSALGTVCETPIAAAEIAPAIEPDLSPATELALSCAAADVVLTDVVEKDGKVKLVGVAAGRFVGRTISLVLTHTGATVATAVVGPDGWFRARAPLPAKAIRFTNDARYQAVIEDERSLALKLHRRMRISRMKPAGGSITITGRIYGRMGDDAVVISRRESCTKDVEVAKVRPDRDGTWRITLPVPAGVDAATYRATTQVRKGENPKRFRTFTLPGHVSL